MSWVEYVCVFVLVGPDDSDEWKTLQGSFSLSLHPQDGGVYVCVREVLTCLAI